MLGIFLCFPNHVDSTHIDSTLYISDLKETNLRLIICFFIAIHLENREPEVQEKTTDGCN